MPPSQFDLRIDAKAGLAVTGVVSAQATTTGSLTQTAPTRLGGTAGVFWNRSSVVSDTLGVSFVASTSAVRADSIIQVTLQVAGGLAIGSNALLGHTFAVLSVSPGGFFRYGTVNSVAAVGSYTAMWEIKNQSA